jgi:hypothetical protein
MKPKPLTALNQTIFPRIAACLPLKGAPSARSGKPRVAGPAEKRSAAQDLRGHELGSIAVLLHDLISVQTERTSSISGSSCPVANDEPCRDRPDILVGRQCQGQSQRAVDTRAFAPELVDVVVDVRRGEAGNPLVEVAKTTSFFANRSSPGSIRTK